MCVALLAGLLAWGCSRSSEKSPEKSSPAPKQPPTTEAGTETPEPDVCTTGYANVLRIQTESQARAQVLARLKRTRTTFVETCRTQPEAVQRCLADAKTREDLGRCPWLGPDAKPPREDETARCTAIYDRMLTMVAAEKPPDHVLQRMRDRRDEGIGECTREPEAVIDCLAEAQALDDVRRCKGGPGQSTNAPNPEHVARCGTVYDTLLGPDGPSDIPKPFRDRWTSRRSRFVDECARMEASAITCMEQAKAFIDYRRCVQ